jgi:multiple sugar transport system substrate-binding protein
MMTRRGRFSIQAMMAVLLVTVFCVASVFAASQRNFNWKRYAGTTLRIVFSQNEWVTAMQPLSKEFEDLTGIHLVYDVYPEDQARQKLAMEFAGGMSTADLFYMHPMQEGLYYEQAGYFAHLEKFLANKKLTNPQFDIKDFGEAGIKDATVKGHLIALPIVQEVSFLGYRKDLFNKYHVKVPQTFAELKAAAAKLTLDTDGDGKMDVYGITYRGRKAAATSQWVTFLYGMGGKWLTDDGAPAINSPEAIQAYETYGEILRKYGPPGAVNDSVYEVASNFSQGRAAMIIDTSSRLTQLEDKTKSLVAGKIGYAVVPGGSAGSKPAVLVSAIAMSSFSKHKEAAWLYLQWACSKEKNLFMLLKGQPVPRKSAWNNSQYKKTDKYPEMSKVILKSIQIGNNYWNPPVLSVAEVREAVGQVIVDAILGKANIKASADKAAQEMKKIIESTK